MQAAAFARNQRSVSRLGFGAMGLAGWFGTYSEDELIRSVLHALDSGIDFIDTARAYGRSEEILHRALKAWKGRAPFVASKVNPLGPNTKWGCPIAAEVVFPRGHVTREIDLSLRTLGVERIDLMQLHVYWGSWGTEGYWLDELDAARAADKIALAGVSLPDHRHDVALPLVRSGRIDSVQTIMNIFDPFAGDCLIPACLQHGVGVIARCILDEGGLAGFLKADTTFESSDFRSRYFDSVGRDIYLRRVEALRQFVPAEAASLATLAVKYVLAHPGVTTAISSMHVNRFADENIGALREPPLDPAVVETLRLHHRWTRNFYEAKYV
ncbi:aldo/keto reductase [Opitutus sp. GAS368]|jgi:methylglyoxal reductase|uniref:aldo/keto reductase n=1 Tax=Opitutus sp. GAS368 TaxID=1882749 RepID=UPI00087A3633|nr:aldo/keto reductase [Opitutus sp. GAS368]SDS18482.1 Predicted oxidoreductase [Opitutus sp. GAS368]